MNRYYDPDSGQYLTTDPIGLEGGLRTHGYVHDPMQWVDPLGLAPCGKYSNIQDPKNVGPGKEFTAVQKRQILAENRNRNGGRLRDDDTGRFLAEPKKSVKGVTPSPHEAQVDHVIPRQPADPNVTPGTNSNSNAKVISRTRNRAKSNNI